MDNVDSYNVLLAIATNIPVLFKARVTYIQWHKLTMISLIVIISGAIFCTRKSCCHDRPTHNKQRTSTQLVQCDCEDQSL